MNITRIEFIRALVQHLNNHPAFVPSLRLKELDLIVDGVIMPTSSCTDLLNALTLNIIVGNGTYIAAEFAGFFRSKAGEMLTASDIQRFEQMLNVVEKKETAVERCDRLERKRAGQRRQDSKKRTCQKARSQRRHYENSVQSFNDVDRKMAEMLRAI